MSTNSKEMDEAFISYSCPSPSKACRAFHQLTDSLSWGYSACIQVGKPHRLPRPRSAWVCPSKPLSSACLRVTLAAFHRFWRLEVRRLREAMLRPHCPGTTASPRWWGHAASHTHYCHMAAGVRVSQPYRDTAAGVRVRHLLRQTSLPQLPPSTSVMCWHPASVGRLQRGVRGERGGQRGEQGIQRHPSPLLHLRAQTKPGRRVH